METNEPLIHKANNYFLNLKKKLEKMILNERTNCLGKAIEKIVIDNNLECDFPLLSEEINPAILKSISIWIMILSIFLGFVRYFIILIKILLELKWQMIYIAYHYYFMSYIIVR